ncbi:hypothetical protein O181_035977 [Austropuccinia psidii MF-1]|uniref:Carbonic anhydrase n=1 Tax=Austropuccinia psidii MF-1 TaxID=1389203 RepID=A0A9Q3D9R0_9BASI|nr:hypothetical protein [Austropuccinia psidii MF-1]
MLRLRSRWPVSRTPPIGDPKNSLPVSSAQRCRGPPEPHPPSSLQIVAPSWSARRRLTTWLPRIFHSKSTRAFSSKHMSQDLAPRPSSPVLRGFLDRNDKFAASCDPQTLLNASQGQSPSVFWLGCSDSRVSEALAIGAQIGEVFVHRNIANLFNPQDTSATAALAFAVNVLKVSHVIVVGHESCGGCAAALAAATADSETPQQTPIEQEEPSPDIGRAAISKWISPIKDLAANQLKTDPNGGLTKLINSNVEAQVRNITQHQVIQKAWGRGRDVQVHGWVFNISSDWLSCMKEQVSKSHYLYCKCHIIHKIAIFQLVSIVFFLPSLVSY